jgi:ankyrin repeat protein
LGIERADENISADRIRRDELIFHRIVGEMAVDSQIARGVALHKLRTYLRKDSSNVDVKSEHDETALHLAVLTGIDEAIPELLKYGADVNVESTHKARSLHFAVYKDNRAIVELLLDKPSVVRLQMRHGGGETHRTRNRTADAKALSHSERVQISHGARKHEKFD